jgi:hypothetical protein
MDTRPEGLSVKGTEVNFRSLSLGGVRGKVRATLTENQVSFESRSGHALDIRLDAIQRVHHHHTTLIPGWLAAVGVIFMWVAWRGVNGQLQAILGAMGIVLSLSHFMTRRPTLTIDTKADDCHTVFGSDLAMIRLCSLIQKIHNGMTLEEAKSSVDTMVNDSEYPRFGNTDDEEIILEPVEIFPSPVIGHFLDTINPILSEDETESPEIASPAIVIEDLDLPIWDDEDEPLVPEVSPNLISRAQSNLFTQRNNIIQNGWQEPQPQQPFNEVHRAQIRETPSYEMLQNQGMIPNYSAPVNNPQPTPIPTDFLPSFVGASGAHVPGINPATFTSPDAPLQQPEVEEVQSLVASARKDEPLEATIVADPAEVPVNRYPNLSKLSTNNSRKRITTRKSRNSRLRGSSVIAELVKPSFGRASAITKKLFRRKSRTSDALRLQAEQSRQAVLADSIQNLAKSKGGDVSDEEVSNMLSHLSSQPVIPSNFGDLVSTESKINENKVTSLQNLEE